MTKLEQILGKNYKWWYLFTFGFKVGTAYRFANLFWFISELVVLTGSLVVWYINRNTDFSFQKIFTYFTYFIVGKLLALLH